MAEEKKIGKNNPYVEKGFCEERSSNIIKTIELTARPLKKAFEEHAKEIKGINTKINAALGTSIIVLITIIIQILMFFLSD